MSQISVCWRKIFERKDESMTQIIFNHKKERERESFELSSHVFFYFPGWNGYY